ncbi:hypothetical protein HHO41_05395 [Bacillus sp. DNRA2]|uniref:hypothetical protein n=1 Tax=Bacillus sp. DNRA2 TaxID=2723053 RepID=UPI00145C5D58|nr:hypothetical protein [Bacillus sp. DNRA2]NMD69714.1 hypothetical protein [Bacillus sp. DNRA2]
MKTLQMVLMALLFVFALNFVTTGNNLVSADDDDDKKYEQYEGGEERGEDSPYEDLGKTVGWGTVIAMGTAGIIFPLRRSMKAVTTNFPEAKKGFIALTKFFGKFHIPIGIIALGLSIFHGITMYLSEGELESEGIIGLGSVVLMAIAGIVGAVLFKNKKAKSLRTTHTILIAFALLIGAVHIFAS